MCVCGGGDSRWRVRVTDMQVQCSKQIKQEVLMLLNYKR